MRVGGRVSPAGAIPLIYLYVTTKLVASSDYGIPIEIKLWDTGRTPLAHMVDVTNGFGLKVLAEHNFLNDNNIAFSPYGLMGILVALYEGVDGEASYQVQRGMQLPWNRSVMRIGFRDIHRTLKTYFVPEEGFLAGLALNNENVTFNENYKKILRFYGFDLDNDQLPTLPPNNGTNETNSTAPAVDTSGPADNSSTTVAIPSASGNTSSTQAREETTTNPNAETLNDVDIRGPTTTISPLSAPFTESTTGLNAIGTADRVANTEEVTSTETTVQTKEETTTTEAIITTIAPPVPEETTVAVSTVASTTFARNTEIVAPQTSPTSTAAITDVPTENNEIDNPTTPDVSSTAAQSTADITATITTESTAVDASVITTANTKSMAVDTTTITIANTQMTETEITKNTMPEVQQSEQTASTADMTTIQDVTTTVITESTLETLQRKKKSIVDFIFTSPPYVNDYLYRSYDIPIGPEPTGPNFDDSSMFLANGLRNVQVTYMHYDTVLEHAYLPHLEASALRLPLDSERYYLLVVLPSRAGAPALGRLLARMARESDLSDVCSVLRPRRVRAIVPSFTVKGHVTLTTDLQKLGIRDVFEPRQRDFTPMTHQAGVYVRSIEQAVSVAIRKYRPDDKKNRYVTNRQPVSFSATYPFLYFVMDASIHVALMAGKMVDPLNTRIL